MTVLNATTQVVGGKSSYRVDMRQSLGGTAGDPRSTWLTIPHGSGDVSVHITLLGTHASDEALIDRIIDGVDLN